MWLCDHVCTVSDLVLKGVANGEGFVLNRFGTSGTSTYKTEIKFTKIAEAAEFCGILAKIVKCNKTVDVNNPA